MRSENTYSAHEFEEVEEITIQTLVSKELFISVVDRLSLNRMRSEAFS